MNSNTGQPCSSGLAMDVGGRRWSTTSGHCATAEGQTFTTGAGSYFGTNRQRRFPDPDLMLVGSSAGNYSNRIYADTMRRVTSKLSNGVVNFCLSGQETQNICSIQSDWDNATYCDNQGCTFHLYRVRHTTAGTIIGRPGDSGGPAYGKVGTFEASARGSIVSTDDSGFTLYLHNVGTMESAFGGTIALN